MDYIKAKQQNILTIFIKSPCDNTNHFNLAKDAWANYNVIIWQEWFFAL